MSEGQGRLGLAIGGGLIGGFFGAPGLGLAAGSLAGTLLFPGSDPPPALGPRLGDLSMQVSAYGNPIPWIFGSDRCAGNIIWNSDIREIPHKHKSSGGGKGGAPQQESFTFTYEVDLCISLCRGPIDGLGKLWANDQLIYDFSSPSASPGISLKLYRGTTDQLPDPTMEADKGAGNVPAYRGQAYVVLRKLDLTPFQNSIPTFHFQVHADGAEAVTTVSVADSPSGGGTGRVAIDPSTGLIWVTRNGTGKVEAFSAESGLTRVCQIDHPSAHMISFQPSFLAVSVDAIGTVRQQLVPAKMWVGSHTPDGFPNGVVKSYATDASCRVLDTIEDPLLGSNLLWPGAVLVDLASIDLLNPNMDSGPTLYIGSTNGAGVGITTHSLSPLVTTGPPAGLSYSPSYNRLQDAGLEKIADWCQAGTFVVGIDWDGRLFLLESQLSAESPEWAYIGQTLAVAGFGDLGHSVTYDPEEPAIYTKARVFSTGVIKIAKWTAPGLVKVWEKDANVAGDNFFVPVRIRYHHGVGDIWVVGKDNSGANTARRLDKQTGAYTETLDLDYTGSLDDFQPFPGAPFAVGTQFGTPGATVKFPLGSGAIASPPTLASVVTAIATSSDYLSMVGRAPALTPADLDVTDLEAFYVRGYKVSQRQPIRNALQPLLQAYFIDAVESEDKIKFVRRGQNPVMVIPPGDLNARRDGETNPGTPITEQRTQETELPTSLDVRYISLETDYKINPVNARRLIGDSSQVRTQDLPIVFMAAEAKQIVDVLMNNIWFERTNKTITLSKRYLMLEPTDVVTITTPDQGQINVRINSTSFSIPNLLSLQVAEEDLEVYDGYVSPAPIGLQPQPARQVATPVALLVMDTSSLRSGDNNTGLYVVAYAIGGAFDYAEVWQSNDGVTYSPAVAITQEGNIGYAESHLTWEGSFS